MTDEQDAPALLRAWRAKQRTDEGKPLSQAGAAELVGVRQNTWSDWENSQKKPQISQALRIARVTKGDVPVEAWGERDDDLAEAV